MSKALSTILAGLSLLCTHCGAAPDAGIGATASSASALTATDLQAARDSLLAADADALAMSSTTPIVEGLGSLFTEDAMFLAWRTRILQGSDVIRTYLATLPGAATSTLSWVTARGDVSVSGDAGYTFGWSTYTSTAADGTSTVLHGKFMAYWRLEPEGWRISGYYLFQHVLEPAPPPAPEWLHQMGDAGQRGMPAVDGTPDVAELIAVDTAFSDLSAAVGSGPAFGTYAAHDGVSLPNLSPMVFGREAIEASSTAPAGSPPLTWQPRAGEIAAGNDLGYTVGYYFSGGRWAKYMTFWERQPNHQWRFILDGGASVRGDVPPTGL